LLLIYYFLDSFLGAWLLLFGFGSSQWRRLIARLPLVEIGVLGQLLDCRRVLSLSCLYFVFLFALSGRDILRQGRSCVLSVIRYTEVSLSALLLGELIRE
jgi:hypothetical protein